MGGKLFSPWCGIVGLTNSVKPGILNSISFVIKQGINYSFMQKINRHVFPRLLSQCVFHCDSAPYHSVTYMLSIRQVI